MITRLILVRHAETMWPVGRLVGQADPRLSRRGREQADALVAELAPRTLDAIATSPLDRACQTAAPIALACGLASLVDAGLREINLGRWEGKEAADLNEGPGSLFERWLDDPTTTTPPGGESLAEVAQRALPLVDSLVHEWAGRTLLLVTHSVVARVIVSHLLGAGLGLVGRIKLKRASITEFRLSERGTTLVGLGTTAHLRRPALVA